MSSGRTIRTLDEVAARLRAGDNALDGDTAQRVADQLERAADRVQEVADLRAAVVLLRQPPRNPQDRQAARSASSS